MSVELIEFIAISSLLKVKGLDFVDPVPDEFGFVRKSIFPEGVQEPDGL